MNLKLGAFIIVFVSLFSLYKTFSNFKRNKLTTRLLAMWSVIWLSIAFFALFPQFLDSIMGFFNMGNRLFFLTSGAIIILFVIIFYLTSTISRMNKKLSTLAQEVSILNFKLEEKEAKGQGEPNVNPRTHERTHQRKEIDK